MNKLRIWVVGAFSLFLVGSCYAAANTNPHNSGATRQTTFFFRSMDALVLLDYKTNLSMFKQLDEVVAAISTQPIDSITVCGYASPDGDALSNYKLARERAVNFRGALYWRYPVLKERRVPMSISFRTINWDAVLLKIEHDENLPSREIVVKILRSQDANKTKEQKLKDLTPDAYCYMQEYVLPKLRSAVSCVVYFEKGVEKEVIAVDLLSQEPAQEPVQNLTQESTPEPTPEAAQAAQQPIKLQAQGLQPAKLQPTEPQLTEVQSKAQSDLDSVSKEVESMIARPVLRERRPLFAVKTNLLSDIAITPNLELEIPIGKRWSINVEYQYGWWLRSSRPYCWQIESGGVEARYWFGDRSQRSVLTGWFSGVAVSGGMYDFQFKSDNGNRGEFYTGGFTGGYSAQLVRNLNLEFSLGIGYVFSDYKHYVVTDGVLIKQFDERYRSVLPVKAKISLVWVINRNSKTGGVR